MLHRVVRIKVIEGARGVIRLGGHGRPSVATVRFLSFILSLFLVLMTPSDYRRHTRKVKK